MKNMSNSKDTEFVKIIFLLIEKWNFLRIEIKKIYERNGVPTKKKSCGYSFEEETLFRL